MVESVGVLGVGRIRERTEKLSGQLPENGTIRVSTEKLSGRVPEKGRIRVSTEKW